MTREMQDGINSDAAGMDHSIALVAYYIDGPFAWTAAEIALFPHSVHVRIATRWTTRDGNVIDQENGDATPAQAAAWANQRRLDGYAWPTVYCTEANKPLVIAAFQAIGEPLPLWWLAHWDNLDVLPAGAIAKQYADPGPLDKSVVADFWPGVDQGGTVTDPQAIAAAVLNEKISGPNGPTPYSENDMEYWTNFYANQIPGIGDTEKTILAQQTVMAQQLTAIQATIDALSKAVAAIHPAPALAGQASVTIQLAPLATP